MHDQDSVLSPSSLKMKFSNNIIISASAKKVFYWLEDPDRAKQWMTSVKKSEIIKEIPDRVGTTFCEYIEEDGRGTEMHGIITEFIRNERFAVHLEGEYNSVDVCFRFKEKGSLTQLSQDVDLRFKGIMKILSIFIKRSLRAKIHRQSYAEFEKLKELCEK